MVDFQLAAESRVMLKAGTPDAAIIRGINKLRLPGILRNVVEVSEFGVDFDFAFTSGGKWGTVGFGGNMVIGDATGQDLLKQYLVNNTRITDIRFYYDYKAGHFVAADLANDPDAGYQVSKNEPGEADKNGIYSLEVELVCNGRSASFFNHQTANTIAFVTGTPATITDTGSGFETAGLKDGQSLIIEGSPGNSKQVLINTVVPGTITLATGHALTTEAAGASITLHGGQI